MEETLNFTINKTIVELDYTNKDISEEEKDLPNIVDDPQEFEQEVNYWQPTYFNITQQPSSQLIRPSQMDSDSNQSCVEIAAEEPAVDLSQVTKKFRLQDIEDIEDTNQQYKSIEPLTKPVCLIDETILSSSSDGPADLNDVNNLKCSQQLSNSDEDSNILDQNILLDETSLDASERSFNNKKFEESCNFVKKYKFFLIGLSI